MNPDEAPMPDYIEPVDPEELNQLAPAQLHEHDCTGEPEGDTDEGHGHAR